MRSVMKGESRKLASMVGMLSLAAALGMPLQAGAAEAEDAMTVTDSVQRARMQAPRPDRRLTETRSVVVSYADLDLSRQAGVDTLYTRLRSASKTVCGTRDVRIVQRRRDWDRCYDEALDNAVATVGVEQMVAEHRAQTGRDVGAASRLAGSP